MTSRKGRKLWSGEVPVETLQELKKEASESDLPQWKVVDQALRMYLGLDEGSTEAALERQLEDARTELEQRRQQREQIEQEEDQLEDRLDMLSDQLENIREQKQSYKEQLDEILENLLENPNQTAMAYMSEIRSAATDEYGRDTKNNISRVIADLHDRRDKRGLEIPDTQFKRTGASVTSDAPAAADGGQEQPDIRFLSESDDNSTGENE